MAAIISEFNHTFELVELLNGAVDVYQFQNDGIKAYQTGRRVFSSFCVSVTVLKLII